ncbi:hypothetical protein [Candidatus Binatus sp.]|uniref:hypothetical protein n=1 Tax=Candidatus Binatus sp. TaxID=2811406 RepID=UPI003C5ADBE7
MQVLPPFCFCVILNAAKDLARQRAVVGMPSSTVPLAYMVSGNMSPAEIVFWISLFGLDFGAPLMLPERWRFRTGLILTTLSLAGLTWSAGFAPQIPVHLGVYAFVASITVGAVSSFAARCLRERDFKLAIINSADAISAYAGQVNAETVLKRRQPSLLPMFKLDWDGIVTKYDHALGKHAARLVKEICNREYRQFAKEVVRNPTKFEDFAHIAGVLKALAITSPEYRMKRLIEAIAWGLLVGALAFLFVQIVLMTKSGELEYQLNRLAGGVLR